MPLTPEQRAEISRQNGAKSRGPITPEGKARSSQNALKHGEFAEKWAQMNENHPTLATEDRADFDALVRELTAQYRPLNPIAAGLVRDIAIARWQIDRLYHALTSNWHLAQIDATRVPSSVTPELELTENLGRSSELVAGLSARLNRQIAQLHIHLHRLQRHFLFANSHFQANEPEPQPQLVESTSAGSENQPAVFTTETDKYVLEAYRREYPGHKIVILPPDNVAKGIDEPDNLPAIPRKAA